MLGEVWLQPDPCSPPLPTIPRSVHFKGRSWREDKAYSKAGRTISHGISFCVLGGCDLLSRIYGVMQPLDLALETL